MWVDILMKKRLLLTIGVIAALLICMSAVYALDCSDDIWFDYGDDYGTWLPYDDMRGYTIAGASEHGYEGEGTDLYAYVYVESGEDSDERIAKGTGAMVDTGWLKLSGHDHGIIAHYAYGRCNYPGCTGYNYLPYTVVEV